MTSLIGLVATNKPLKPKANMISLSKDAKTDLPPSKTIENGYKNDSSLVNGEAQLAQNKKPSKNLLPLGMKCLVEDYFVPGAKGCYEVQPRLPLLKNTNIAILHQTRLNAKATGNLQNDLLRDLHDKQHANATASRFTNSSMALVRSNWEIIASFMKDENEKLDKGQNTRLFENTVHQRRTQFLSKKRLWRKSSITKTPLTSELNQRPSSMYVIGGVDPGNQSAFSKQELANMTVLEKIRFITSTGLENHFMKDEIYCQILKQLVNNPSPRSNALGWILLALVTGSFPPSKKILPHVEEFIDQHNFLPYSAFCRNKLNKILIHGDRQNPPCSLELQAAKSRSEMRIPVICMDQSVRTIWVNSSTTAHEVCRAMALKNRLGDSFGFSLYIALNNKLVTLGNGNFYIMDAISQAEQFTRLNDVHEVWRIYYRREFFSPRDAGGIQANQMKTLLTYSQVCGGVRSGEYQINKSQDLALLLAHQYCVRYGDSRKVDMQKVMAVCDHNLPQNVYKDDKKKKWCLMVYTTLEALSEKAQLSTNEIMQQVIRYASKSFITNFTKSFTLSSFKEKDGVTIKGKHQLKINHEQVTINQTPPGSGDAVQNVIVVIPVIQLKKVEVLKSKLRTPQLQLTLFSGKDYILGSVQSCEIVTILSTFVQEVQGGANESSA